jgi:hypothetical protein
MNNSETKSDPASINQVPVNQPCSVQKNKSLKMSLEIRLIGKIHMVCNKKLRRAEGNARVDIQ